MCKHNPCSHPDCEEKLAWEDLDFCPDCGAPTCGKHDNCWLCDGLEDIPATCENCGRVCNSWDELEMPYCAAHYGECDDRYQCEECREKWTCPGGGQYELALDYSDGSLPF